MGINPEGLVSPVSAGRLEIQDEHHRTADAKKAGLNKISVLVWE